tara:strand:+ start:2104 stop:2424 length:321 start_codon:yes stop_codon:yes gene_type:complete
MVPERSGLIQWGTPAAGAVSPANPTTATSALVEVQALLRGSDLVLPEDNPFLFLPDHPHSRAAPAEAFQAGTGGRHWTTSRILLGGYAKESRSARSRKSYSEQGGD